MKISNYNDFLRENYQDTPEEYIKVALMKLKNKIDSFFGDDGDKTKGLEGALKRGKDKEKSGFSFKDLNVNLESSEISTHPATYDSLTVKFSDADFSYSLYITIPLESGIPKDDNADFSDKDIEECSIKFKKYDYNTDIIGQIGPKNVKISDISQDFLVDLKIELDDEFNSDEEFEIET